MTEAEHVELGRALADGDASVMVSGYPSRLYSEMFADWHQVDLTAQSSNANALSAHEVIWSNCEVANYLDLGAIA